MFVDSQAGLAFYIIEPDLMLMRHYGRAHYNKHSWIITKYLLWIYLNFSFSFLFFNFLRSIIVIQFWIITIGEFKYIYHSPFTILHLPFYPFSKHENHIGNSMDVTSISFLLLFICFLGIFWMIRHEFSDFKF